MTETKIMVPIMAEAKVFEALKSYGVEKALRQCADAGYNHLFMPQIADARINASEDDYIAQNWFSTPSVRVTGRTRGGGAVVVYAHIPNYFSKPENIAAARKAGLENGAGKMPEKAFYDLLGLEDGKDVYVIDYNTLKNSESGVIEVSKAMKHPQTIPFLGGKERVERYLAKHKKLYGETIGIWHSDDLKDVPLGRALCVGDSRVRGLCGSIYFDIGGRVLGVVAAEPHKAVVREAQRENGATPSLETVISQLSATGLQGKLLELARQELAPLYQK